MDSRRIGFYPVCARDYLGPLQLLKGWVDELVFCHIKCMPVSTRALTDLREVAELEDLPAPTILVGDALLAIQMIKPVDLFFLRRDSGGEGGSALNLLGAERLPDVVAMIRPGGLLVTDRGADKRWVDDFCEGRRSNYQVRHREICFSYEQPWAEQGLFSFVVR
jgi:hypothetical protein